MTERVPTGINGLDELIEGGFVKDSVNLIAGGAGTGKTLFSCQFLWEGLKNGENCLFITLEEDPDQVLLDAKEFDWDFEKYDDDDQFKIVYLNPFKDSGGFADRIRSEVEHIEADRVVIDSTSVMGMYDENPGRIRERLYTIVRMLRRKGVTSVLTSEIPEDEDKISRFGVEEFVADGVIRMEYISIGRDAFGQLEVRKMRRTNVEKGEHEVIISENGLSVGEEMLDLK